MRLIFLGTQQSIHTSIDSPDHLVTAVFSSIALYINLGIVLPSSVESQVAKLIGTDVFVIGMNRSTEYSRCDDLRR